MKFIALCLISFHYPFNNKALAKKGQISDYQEFVSGLQANLSIWLKTPKTEWAALAAKSVDGLASDEVRRLVSLENRRQDGIFFTDSLLARKVFAELRPVFNSTSKIYDPACGAGNLLIAAANYIRSQKVSLTKDNSYMGTDIHEPFAEAAKIRFHINELLFSAGDARECLQNTDRCFISEQADGLSNNEFYQSATHIVANPPFNLTQTDEKLSWSQGQVSAAALFMDKIIQYVNAGASICAILPDVLRSGSRYEKWRKEITKNCTVDKTQLHGQFDKYADVDVFSIRLTKRSKQFSFGKNTFEKSDSNTDAKTIEDVCKICVGPVVDNRDKKIGPVREFIVSKGLKGWTKQTQFSLTRKHSGRSFKSPFVVVKRTSRMGDSQRAVATIINAKKNVFVDNHLIVLQPKSGKLEDCKAIVANLKKTETDNWLNRKIRCRHLTVKVVSKIPIWP